MHITLDVYNSQEYFEKLEKEIDYDKTGNQDMISLSQSDLVDYILTTEASIYALRRATGTDGYQVDMMVSLRRRLITEYENTYKETYITHNDFY